MPILIPSILEDNIENFNAKCVEILKIPEVKRIQIDFSDGQFAKRRTLMPADLDLLNPAYVWEAHLMANDPAEYFFDLKVAGFNNVIFHFEAAKKIDQIEKLLEELAKMNISPGLAINPETPIEEVSNIASAFESILIMGVHPGWQGQQILTESLEKIKKLKNTLKNVIIEFDGGVKLSNISDVVAAGAERIVVNSALFDKGENGDLTPAQNFEKIAAFLR